MGQDPKRPQSWDGVASELQSYREEQETTWGEVDNLLLACYLSDDVTDSEREYIEAELEAHPELQKLTDLVREVMVEPVSPVAEEPPILSFSTAQRTKRPFRGRLHQMVALAAAACALFALGLFLNQSPNDNGSSFAYVSDRVGAPPTPKGADSARTPKPEMAVASRSTFHRELMNSSLHMLNGNFEKATDELVKVAKSSRSAEAPPRSTVVDHIVQTCEMAVDRMDRKRMARSRPQKMLLKSNPEGAPESLPRGGSRLAADDPQNSSSPLWSTKNQKWVRKAIPFVIDGFEQTSQPELRNRCAWALAQISPKVEESLSKQQRMVYQRALSYYYQCQPQWLGLQDKAGLLSQEARRNLDNRLQQISRQTKVEVVAETIRSMDPTEKAIYARLSPVKQERFLDGWARRRSRAAGAHRGVYVLLSMDPPTLRVTLGPYAFNSRPVKSLQALSALVPTFEQDKGETHFLAALEKIGGSTFSSFSTAFRSLPFIK